MVDIIGAEDDIARKTFAVSTLGLILANIYEADHTLFGGIGYLLTRSEHRDGV
jgi:hypothetical protein